jgi:hypothetical protein
MLTDARGLESMKHLGSSSIERFFGHRDKPEIAVRGEQFCVDSSKTEGADLNGVARSSLDKLATILQNVCSSDQTFLATIESDLIGGRFPSVLDRYFRDESWRRAQRFYVPELRKDTATDRFLVAHITFEADPRALRRILCPDDGVLWAGNLSVGGVVVPTERVQECVDKNPFIYEQLAPLSSAVQVAFVLDSDLIYVDALAIDGAATSTRQWLAEAWNEGASV